VFVVGSGAALRARLHRDFVGPLESAGFFEAPMSSLFHVVLPVSRRCLNQWQCIAAEAVRRTGYPRVVAEDLDVDAMIERFRARAKAVRQRGIPPLEGPERKRFVDQARIDFMDYAMIGDAEAKLDDGILTLRINLRPKAADS
jgi:hypothetical protein